MRWGGRVVTRADAPLDGHRALVCQVEARERWQDARGYQEMMLTSAATSTPAPAMRRNQSQRWSLTNFFSVASDEIPRSATP